MISSRFMTAVLNAPNRGSTKEVRASKSAFADVCGVGGHKSESGLALWLWPNILTLARVCTIPFIVLLFFTDTVWGVWARNSLFIMAAATDFLDGYIARFFNQTSRLGQLIDPLADKLLVATTLVMLVAANKIMGWLLLPALCIIARDLAVPTLRERYVERFQKPLKVSLLARFKTAIEMVALTCLMVGSASGGDFSYLLYMMGAFLLLLAATLSVLSFVLYVRQVSI